MFPQILEASFTITGSGLLVSKVGSETLPCGSYSNTGKLIMLKRIFTYQEGRLFIQEIVCFPIQRYRKRRTEVKKHSYRAVIGEAGRRFVLEKAG